MKQSPLGCDEELTRGGCLKFFVIFVLMNLIAIYIWGY